MFRLSRKALYAVEAVLDINYKTGANPVQSLEFTRRQCIPRRYLGQALQRLVRGGILAGVRVPRGGYRGARKVVRAEGLPFGISSRATIVAMLETATRRKMIGKAIVAILPFLAERYLSKVLFESLY